ncbi:MAG TPA: hypothetical protein EYP56_05755 [Planctomycetaceae bacterium]|nr:hypothetical protein [Planctomycetaceae bacterium]HIQ21876.1 hypothetical protein [Planctomycetota bacterium]
MVDFEQRLEKAIQRGKRASDARARVEAEKALSEQELRRLHTQCRLELCEHIQQCLEKLAQYFPGFRLETIHSEQGWGTAISRDDVEVQKRGRRTNYFSRLEMTIPPVNQYFVLELAAKATIRNKEYFNRRHFEKLADLDLTSFTELIDRWTLEYAELYASKS